MIYFMNPKTFAIKSVENEFDYTLSTEVIYSEPSEIVLGETLAAEGDIAYIDNFWGIVSSLNNRKNSVINSENDKNIIKLLPLSRMFDIDILKSQTVTTEMNTNVESFIAAQIDKYFTNCTDPEFKKSYFSVTAKTVTANTLVLGGDDHIWNLCDFIESARKQYGIKIRFSSPTAGTLKIEIYNDSINYELVDLNTMDFNVVSETYANEIVSAVTVHAQDTNAISNYYLLENGSVSTSSASANRVLGNRKTVSVSKFEESEAKANEIFSSNQKSHCIEFESTRIYDTLDKIKIKTKNGRIFDTEITAVVRYKNNSVRLYRVGELRNSLKSKLCGLYGG